MGKEANYEKQYMYKNTIRRLNRAIKNEYYYEAIMLDYALIEDRTNEFLKFLGIINEKKGGVTVTTKAKCHLRTLLEMNENARFDIKKIVVKLKIITRLAEYEGTDPFLKDLHLTIINKIETVELVSLINRIESWKDERNDLVHGLMNKVSCECDDAICRNSIEGKGLFREIDKYTRRIKNNDIRRRYRIQPY